MRKSFIAYKRAPKLDDAKKIPLQQDAVVIGSGMAGLTVGSLLAKEGLRPLVLEQNWLPGGCSSSYPRKNYVFESGATTLVGLEERMPLQFLLDEIDLEVQARKLEIPMKVYLKNGKMLTRYQNLDQWIGEAERVFGGKQRKFWEFCYEISQLVWDTSIQQRAFPPSSFSDLLYAAQNFRPKQLKAIPHAFRSVDELLQKYELKQQNFLEFVDEQLMITAQNYHKEVNVLFGATALCYTNYKNFYVDGGLIELVNPLVNYIEKQGGRLLTRTVVKRIERKSDHYYIYTNQGEIKSKYLLSSIPINDTLSLWDDENLRGKYERKLLKSPQLSSAFSLGFVATKRKIYDCLHHQIHLSKPLPYLNSNSIFLSLSHPEDHLRCAEDEIIGSVSTHIHHPEERIVEDKRLVEEAIFQELEKHGLVAREDVIFHHSSTPKSWQKWTARSWGFVGGYPQMMSIKPWQMIDARLDGKGAYVCGDSTYPGQGIPGACLSGLIAFEKLKRDYLGSNIQM